MGSTRTFRREWRDSGVVRRGRRIQQDDSGAAQPLARLDAERAAPEAAALREAGAAGAAGGGTHQRGRQGPLDCRPISESQHD
ncbi:MAG: hypothetical protein JO153_20030 [Solirubrobacterales bacterium]|nr:hypothetical protein [Solirubrobacterales bacterium]